MKLVETTLIIAIIILIWLLGYRQGGIEERLLLLEYPKEQPKPLLFEQRLRRLEKIQLNYRQALQSAHTHKETK